MDDRDQFATYINKGARWEERYIAEGVPETNKKFIEYLKKQGYDGIHIKGTEYDAKGTGLDVIDQIVAFDPKNVQTRSQLTDIWNKAHTPSKSLPIPEGLPKIATGAKKAQIIKLNGAKYKKIVKGEMLPKKVTTRTITEQTELPTNTQIDDLSRRVTELAKKGKEEIKNNIDELSNQVAIIEDFLGEMPGRELNRYVSRSTGELPEITGHETMQSLTGSGKIVKNSLFGRKGDEILREIYDGNVPEMDKVLKDLADYRNSRKSLSDIKETIKENRTDVATIRKGERLTRIGMHQRKAQYRAVGDRYNLTDSELAKFRRGRDISAMEQDEFNTFIAEANKFGETTEKRTAAMSQLKATVAYKDLKKWENVAAAMDLPPVHQMDTEQLVNLEKILDAFHAGDEFLPVRMLQTIDNTKLKGAKTVREILEVLGKEKGLTADDVANIKPTEFHRMMGDVALAREHPFFERMIQVKNESFMTATARTIELSDEVSDLVTKARQSRSRSLVERAIPTDDNLVHWLEADVETRAKLSETMTKAELKAAERMDEIFKDYYEYLVAKKADAKFSRFEDTYFPHVRRGFLETWKEDGILKAFKEMKDVYAQDQKYMNILNEQTGEILPYEKWVGFQQYRTDNLVPTANAAKAFESYVTVLEKARHLDEMIPEIMAYVHALSPRTLSERGIELDASLKKFTKEWLNANKGRHPKGFFEPGGKLDWSLRASTTFTRMIDLGFNFTTQLIAPIGEQTMTLTMLKPQAYANAMARRTTAEGKKLLENNRAFTGRTLFDELSKATNDIGDKFTGAMMGVFGVATRTANEIFLLGKVTEAELKSGVISAKRLAELQLEMGKYRAISGLESMLSKTAEGSAALQYKSWAFPILRATYTNSKDLAKLIGEKGIATALSSDVGKELFYSIGLGTAIGGLFYSRYQELGDNKDRSYLEDLQYKAIRDSMSMLGALDPTLWSNVRIMAFYEDLSQAILDLVTLDTYKTTGELKGPAEFARVLTPKVVKQIERGITGDEPTTSSGGTRSLPTPAGLPKLPSAKSKLPTPPGLPKLP